MSRSYEVNGHRVTEAEYGRYMADLFASGYRMVAPGAARLSTPEQGLAERVQSLHVRVDRLHIGALCGECTQHWPCRTTMALAAPVPTAGDQGGETDG